MVELDSLRTGGELAVAILTSLRERGIRHVLLSGFESLPHRVDTDLDVCVGRADFAKLRGVMAEVAREHGGDLCQVIDHESTAAFFVIAYEGSYFPRFLRLDICSDYRRNGVVWLTASEMLQSAVVSGGLPVLDADRAFEYRLVKSLLKRSLNKQAEALREMYATRSSAAREVVSRRCGAAAAAIEQELAEGRGHFCTVTTERARRALLARGRRSVSRGLLAYVPRDCVRVARRLVRPTGLVVAVLGPDGAGKSTLLDCLESAMEPAFRRVERHHFRPGFVSPRSTDDIVTNPHAQRPRGRLGSALKLVFLWADYWLAWLGGMWLRVRASTIVLFDRYMTDLEADPIRYRHGLSGRLTRLATRSVPQPDVTLVLSAGVSSLLARKQEVEPLAMERVVAAYTSLGVSLPGSAVIDADLGQDEVARAAIRAIVGTMVGRAR